MSTARDRILEACGPLTVYRDIAELDANYETSPLAGSDLAAETLATNL